MERERLERELKKYFDAYEVCILQEKTRKYEAADRELYGQELREERGISVRAIKDRKLVFSYTYETGEKAVQTLIENLRLLAPLTEGDPDAVFPGRYDVYPAFEEHDAEGLASAKEAKIAMLLEMEGLILDYDKRIVKTRNCELHEDEVEVELFNSHGLEAKGKKTLYVLGGLCVAKGEEEVSWYDWRWSHKYADLDSKALGRKIAEKALSLLDGEILKTGTYDGILTPGTACEMLGILSSSFLAENLFKGKTKLKEKVGTSCFSGLLFISDSGLRGMGAFPFDGEGVPSADNAVVDRGVFRTFLYDTYYGKKLGQPSTGNGVRSGVKEPPRCASRGFYIHKGESDVYATLTDGVIIEELMGTHTANPVTGDFSLGALGYLVEKGERRPFQGVIFSGNVFELLNNIKAIGADLTFYGTYGAPSILFGDLKISGS